MNFEGNFSTFFSFIVMTCFLIAFQFRLNYTIVESALPSSGLERLNPILDQTEADREFEATFQKDCGSDDVCQSQLEVYPELELGRDGNSFF